MEITRRDLSLLLPALLAAQASPAEKSMAVLPSAVYQLDRLHVKENPNGNKSWQVFTGTTHDGFPIDLHVTQLAPGNAPHAPHHHVHEEMMMMIEGELVVTIGGKSERMGPGGLAYIHSNDEHGLKNVGTVPARYFVLALGHQAA
ncbi:MAG TPA: cupin domain-containing protein [Bryobacteraceae bacterium]|jgi:mannose-6-phosphate isomerase-like protein (cupin superfamily)|nr:cupin domain-containing protein [Bryobacteraceae bacterium]